MAFITVIAFAGCTTNQPAGPADTDQSNREQTNELKDHINQQSMPLKKITLRRVDIRVNCEYENRSSDQRLDFRHMDIQNPVEYADRFVEYPDERVIITNPLTDQESDTFERKVDWCFDQEDARADVMLEAVTYDIVGIHGNRTVVNQTETCRPYEVTDEMGNEYDVLDAAANADWIHDLCLPVDWKPPKEER